MKDLLTKAKTYKIRFFPLTTREVWLLYEAYKRIDGTPESKEHYIRISHLFFHGNERTLEREIERKVEKHLEKQQKRLDKLISKKFKSIYKKIRKDDKK